MVLVEQGPIEIDADHHFGWSGKPPLGSKHFVLTVGGVAIEVGIGIRVGRRASQLPVVSLFVARVGKP